MKNFKKGFTMIELLVVIAIIGILSTIVMVALSGTKEKASVAATKKALSPYKATISLCCASGALVVGGVGGGDTCNPALVPASKYLTAAQLKTTGVNWWVGQPCSGALPTIRIDLNGHPKTECNNNAGWRIRETGILPPTGC